MTDLAEGNGAKCAHVVAKLHGADRDLLDRAPHAADVDVFTAPERIVDQEEHARYDVLNQLLRSESDGNADDAGAGDERQDLDAQRAHDGEHDHDSQRHQEHAAQQGGKRLLARSARASPLATRQAQLALSTPQGIRCKMNRDGSPG